MAMTIAVGVGSAAPASLKMVSNCRTTKVSSRNTEDSETTIRMAGYSMAETGLFPPLAVQMLRVGEETGRIDMTSAHIAEAYERKLEAAIKRLVTLVEPALIIVLGLAVGGIVMSILLAVISINDLAF